MTDHQDWLHAEQSGDDEAAERLFSHLMAEMPRAEPGAEFVDRAVRRAWRARQRRAVLMRASVLVALAAAAGAAYAAMLSAPAVTAWAAGMLSRGLVWLLSSATEAAGWLALGERVGTAMSDAVGASTLARLLAACEMVTILAIFGFRRLLRKE